MTYRFILCEADHDLERYCLYMLDHKKEVHSSFTAKRIVHFFWEQVIHGNVFIVENQHSELVAAGGFVFGTPENNFTDRETVRIEMIHIAPAIRSTRLFVRGLEWFTSHIEQVAPETKLIQFYTESDPIRNHFFKKFANHVVTEPTRFGLEDEFQVSLEQLKRWKVRR